MPNKATIEQGARLAELAKSYSDIAFNTIVDVAINGTSDSARIAAANSILDRGYGKPKSDGVEVAELLAIVIQRASWQILKGVYDLPLTLRSRILKLPGHLSPCNEALT